MALEKAARRRWTAFSLCCGLALLLAACVPQRGAERVPEASAAPVCAATWCLVAQEDFTRPAPLGGVAQVYGAAMAGYPSGHSDTTGKGRYAPERVLSVQNGALDWWVHSENGQPGTAAPLPQGYVGQRYGRWTVRFRADRVEGYKLAFLLWPTSDQWREGELDFPEGELGRDITGFAHDVTGDPSHNVFKFEPGASMNSWHTATLEWTAEHLIYTLDGKQVKSTTDQRAIPKVPMRWVLQVETSLDGPAPAPESEGHVQVDWFKIERWQTQV